MKTHTFTLDNTHSTVGFAVRHMVVARVRGKFTRYGAELAIDPDDLTRSKVKVTLDASSIDTGVADRDAHLRSADFFDAERYPELRFESREVERVGESHYRVTGELTIKDKTRELVLDVEYGGAATDPWGNQRLGFAAKASLDRRDFGLTWNQALEVGGVLVGDRVDIELELEAVRNASEKAA